MQYFIFYSINETRLYKFKKPKLVKSHKYASKVSSSIKSCDTITNISIEINEIIAVLSVKPKTKNCKKIQRMGSQYAHCYPHVFSAF